MTKLMTSFAHFVRNGKISKAVHTDYLTTTKDKVAGEARPL